MEEVPEYVLPRKSPMPKKQGVAFIAERTSRRRCSMCSWYWWNRRVYAVVTRTIPIRHTRNIRNLNDVARTAENAVRKRASRPCRSCVIDRLVSTLLCGLMLCLPFLLEFLILLMASLPDPEPPNEIDDQWHESHSSNNTTGDCSYIRSNGGRRRGRVLDTRHVRAGLTVLRHQRADLAVAACWTCRCRRRTLDAPLE